MRYELLVIAVLALAVFSVACWWLVAYAKQILDDISEPPEPEDLDLGFYTHISIDYPLADDEGNATTWTAPRGSQSHHGGEWPPHPDDWGNA